MKITKQLYYRVLEFLPAKIVLYIEHYRGYKKVLNLKNPVFFGEKIQWLKVNGNLERFSNYVDKYQVRHFIENKIGSTYLNDLIGTYYTPEEIDFDTLPNKFVLKVTHGCGYNIVCRDKNRLNIKKTKKQLSYWLKQDFSNIKKERQYMGITPRIICEKYLEGTSYALTDYKVFCFEGKAKFVQVINERNSGMTQDFFDINWKKLQLRKGVARPSTEKIHTTSAHIEMIKIAEVLAEEFPFVRVDFYIVENQLIFGELTFTPAGGLTPFQPMSMDLAVANLIKLDQY
jgi:hypothetical protein